MTLIPRALVSAARSVRSRTVLAVLVELHDSLDTSDFRKAPICVVAERLEIDERRTYRAIRQLVQMGYLERGPRLGNALTFRLAVHRSNVA